MPTSYAQTVLADNPILYLRLQEPSGASCADSSTSAIAGTAHGTFTRNVAETPAGITPGVTLGGAITDYISVPSSSALNIVGAMTFECWFNTTSLAAAFDLMGKGHSNVSPGGYVLVVLATGVLKLQNGFDGNNMVSTGAGTITTATLFHVVVARDAGGTATIYLNGAQNAQLLTAQTAIATNEPFTIGAISNNGTIANPLPGTIDEVAVYTTALSGAQAAAHYAARNTPAATGGQGRNNAPGQTVQALMHEMIAERKAVGGQHPQRHRISDYRRKRGTGFV